MRVHLAGRLGNQLFSWAFAHHLLQNGNQVSLAYSGVKPEIYSLLGECKHVPIRATAAALRFKLNLFIHLIGIFPRHKKVISQKFNICAEPDLFDISNSRDYLGYFQMFKYLESIEDKVFDELYSALQNIKLPDKFRKWQITENYQCLHIRRGDYLLPENVGYGLLSADWYSKLYQADMPTVIVTDDLVGSSKILETFSDCLVLGPQEANVFQALAIMANSSNFIAANSTLSWWGGFLVNKRGYSVAYPFSGTENHRNLNYPKFNLSRAIYDERGTS